MFCKKPSEKFFEIIPKKPMEKAEFSKLVRARNTKIISIIFKPPKVVPDIVWPQLRRASERLVGMLKENEFRVMNRSSWTDENKIAVIMMEMEVFHLPNVKKMTGPPVFAHANAKNFIEHYSSEHVKPHIEDANWVVEIKRKHIEASEYIRSKLKQDRKTLAEMGIPSHIVNAIASGFKVIEDDDIYKAINSNKDAKAFVREFFGL